MILFVNVIITDVRNQGYVYNRYGLPGSNRLDIFKYSLASLSALNKHWSKVVIYCELDGHYKQRWDEMDMYIKNLFSGIKISLFRHRLLMQPNWQEAYLNELDPVPDNLIWYHGNDDHIFIDYDLGMFDNILLQMYADYEPFICCQYSHWPEYIRFAADNRCWNCGPASVFWSHNTDAIHIISKQLYKHWFWDYKWNHPIHRTDFIKFCAKIGMKCYVPHRELVRHFDGYSHSMHMPSVCPPLHIPEGFFKYNIKILYCGDKPRSGWTLVNPCLPYRTVHHNGADFRFKLDQIPLFWRERISKIEIAKHYSERMLCDARNLEKFVILDPNLRWARKWMPVVPYDWLAPWLIVEPKQPKLI